ncbi:MAG TPA: K(+)-transporting ATPase subunit F [Gemmatimonadaceae bacterium]|nr:K(+)-transporting ATPase subunit F [Gemmatimonadaceae bacterium]
MLGSLAVALIAVGVLAYLVYSLLWPERF